MCHVFPLEENPAARKMAVKKLIARDVANFSCLISSSHMNRMCTRFNSDVSQSVLPLGMRSAERLARKRKQLLDKKKKKKKKEVKRQLGIKQTEKQIE